MSSEIIPAVRNLFESNILEHMYAICSLTPIIAVIGPNKQWKRSCARLDLYAQPSRRNVVMRRHGTLWLSRIPADIVNFISQSNIFSAQHAITALVSFWSDQASRKHARLMPTDRTISWNGIFQRSCWMPICCRPLHCHQWQTF